MKFKKRTLIIASAIFLTMPAYDICKAIYKNGIKDGKATAHSIVKK